MKFLLFATALLSILPAQAQSNTELREQVRVAEIAFAKTMADRDIAAFKSFLADEAIFFSNGPAARGSSQVVEQWKPLFNGPKAPFSWAPDTVEVLASGTLAFSSGPVRDHSGKRTGTFNSVWLRDAEGKWKVLFDKGCPPCNCAPRQ